MRNLRCQIKKVYKDAITIIKSFSGWKHFAGMPPRVLVIELTNVCNANCIFCGYQYDTRRKGIMARDLYLRVIKEFREMGGTAIAFAPLVGEPLVDPEFIDRVKEVKSLGFINIYANTNGILLYKHNIEALLTSGITRLIISTAPFEKERFEKLYRNKEYGKLIEGLKTLLSLNKKMGNPVRIKISFRSDIPLKRVLASLDYKKHIKPYINNERKDLEILLEGYDNWGGMIKQAELLGAMKLGIMPAYKARPCLRTFNCMVTWDGRVRGCGCRFSNLDREDSLFVGSLNGASLKEIWFGDSIRQLRDSFIKGALCLTCRNCTMYASV